MTRRCEVVVVDGTSVRVQTNGKPITQVDRDALSVLVKAVQAQMDAEPVEVQQARAQRQQEARERVRRIRERLDADPA